MRTTKLIPAILIGCAFPASPAPQPAGKPARILILTGSSDEPFHHWRETTVALRDALMRSGRFEVRTNEEPRGLSSEALDGYDAVVLNYNGPRWPVRAEAALTSFVRSGKGLVAFHLAAYGSFFGMEYRDRRWRAGPSAGWKEFSEMLGESWLPENIGHARRTVFQVDWKSAADPIRRGLGPSFVANDELYHKMTLAPGVSVLADALSPVEIGGTGKREPMIWTNRYGRGRVFFTTLGHDDEAWYQPGLRNAFVRGVEWAATGEVSVAPLDRTRRGPAPDAVRVLAVTGGHSFPKAFYAMLDSLSGVAWTHAATPEEAYGHGALENRFDVVLLHDMWETTSEPTRRRLRSFVEAGKGVVALHHAIVDYTDWPYWYREVTGGKYFVKATREHAASRYREGVEFLVSPAPGKERHPVLRGVGPLWVDDELYQGMYHAPGIDVLMETRHPENDRAVVYVGPHPKARVVYIQLGHSEHTMMEPAYRRLVRNAIFWAARKDEEFAKR